MIDRSDAVNLARNLRGKPFRPSARGLQCLVDAVLAMDEYIRSHEAMQLPPEANELAAMMRDAKRYRWLRDNAYAEEVGEGAWYMDFDFDQPHWLVNPGTITPSECDAVIDAAMRQSAPSSEPSSDTREESK